MPLHEYMKETNERLDEHKESIDAMKEEIRELKGGHSEIAQWRQEVDMWRKQTDINYQDIKASIREENQKTQEIFRSTIGRLFDLIDSKDVRSAELKKDQFKLWGTLLGAGGLLFLIVERILQAL